MRSPLATARDQPPPPLPETMTPPSNGGASPSAKNNKPTEDIEKQIHLQLPGKSHKHRLVVSAPPHFNLLDQIQVQLASPCWGCCVWSGWSQVSYTIRGKGLTRPDQHRG